MLLFFFFPQFVMKFRNSRYGLSEFNNIVTACMDTASTRSLTTSVLHLPSFPFSYKTSKTQKKKKGRRGNTAREKHVTRKKHTKKKRHSHELLFFFFSPSKGNPGENRDKACDIYAAFFSPFFEMYCTSRPGREDNLKKKRGSQHATPTGEMGPSSFPSLPFP